MKYVLFFTSIFITIFFPLLADLELTGMDDVSFLVNQAHAEIQFEEMSSTAGISYSGRSVGVSWGDFNGDDWPDIMVGNHWNPVLYINNTDGTFTDSSHLAFYTPSDLHGAAWADFDNDGDQDLIHLVGSGGLGSFPQEFLINQNGLLQNETVQYGLEYPLGRGRTPLWFDWDGDGYLDIFMQMADRSDGQEPSALFTQKEGYFINDNDLTGIDIESDGWYGFAQITHLTDQNIPVLVSSSYRTYVYQYNTVPFLDITGNVGLPSSWDLKDQAIFDFNGDLLTDFFVLQYYPKSVVVQSDSVTIRSWLSSWHDEKGISFRTQGNVRIEIDPVPYIINDDIFIGSQGYHPEGNSIITSSEDEDSIGIFPHSPGVDIGIFLGYDPVTDLWQVFSNNLRPYVSVIADEPISQLSPIGFTNSEGKKKDKLLIQTAGNLQLQDATVAAGLEPTACVSVTAADFDNDMDVDIYLVCRYSIANINNILYENLGNGTFQSIPGAGGAEGSTLGFGESVAAADYDKDGFMDLFVTNGRAEFHFSYGMGPHQLFRNLGNDNHWLEIDLEGVVSNRDGIGARLLVTAGGTTQLREQNGGIHSSSQNHQRIHFGLADNTLVDQLIIQWPSGILQEMVNIPADQIIHTAELDITGFSILDLAPPYTVDFTSNSIGYYEPSLYEWDFDNDGHIDSTAQNPSYTYNNIGTYTVKLTITDSGGNRVVSMRDNYITTCLPVIRLSDTIYLTLQDAYNAAVNDDVIQVTAHSLTEDLIANRNISLNIEGGYNCDFSTQTGNTGINGDIIITDGTIYVENLISSSP